MATDTNSTPTWAWAAVGGVAVVGGGLALWASRKSTAKATTGTGTTGTTGTGTGTTGTTWTGITGTGTTGTTGTVTDGTVSSAPLIPVLTVPLSLAASQITSSGFTLAWVDANPGVIDYEIAVYPIASPILISNFNSTQPTVPVIGLQPGTSYGCEVTALGRGQAIASPAAFLNVTTAAAPAGSPPITAAQTSLSKAAQNLQARNVAYAHPTDVTTIPGTSQSYSPSGMAADEAGAAFEMEWGTNYAGALEGMGLPGAQAAAEALLNA